MGGDTASRTNTRSCESVPAAATALMTHATIEMSQPHASACGPVYMMLIKILTSNVVADENFDMQFVWQEGRACAVTHTVGVVRYCVSMASCEPALARMLLSRTAKECLAEIRCLPRGKLQRVQNPASVDAALRHALHLCIGTGEAQECLALFDKLCDRVSLRLRRLITAEGLQAVVRALCDTEDAADQLPIACFIAECVYARTGDIPDSLADDIRAAMVREPSCVSARARHYLAQVLARATPAWQDAHMAAAVDTLAPCVAFIAPPNRFFGMYDVLDALTATAHRAGITAATAVGDAMRRRVAEGTLPDGWDVIAARMCAYAPAPAPCDEQRAKRVHCGVQTD